MHFLVVWTIPTLVTLGIAWLLALQAGGKSRVFGIPVDPKWRRSEEAERAIRAYRLTMWALALALIGAGMSIYAAGHPAAGLSLPVFGYVIGVAAVWAWAARAVRRHAVAPAAVRSADLNAEAPRLPGGIAAFLMPLALLGGSAAWLWHRWEAIPARFAVHWNLAGQADGWAERTTVGVFRPIWMGAAVCVATLLMALLLVRTARRPAGPAAARRFRAGVLTILIASWIVAIAFSFAALTPLVGAPNFIVVAIFALGSLFAAAWPSLRASMASDDEPDPVSAAPDAWKLGMFYYNLDDPALFVERQFGFGWTLNMARRSAWVILGVTLLPVLFAVISSLS